MKRLEPYYVMEGSSERVYKFEELIADTIANERGAQPGNECVYAIFKPHFGDLHTYMKEKKKLSEQEAKFIFRQCVEAVRDCHDNGIIVRDIKLKKFIFLNPERWL
jgi:serine/threonine protein kinase